MEKLGNYILQNQDAEGWGTKVVDKLAADLTKAFPELKGFSARNLKYMRRFAELYPVPVLRKYLESADLLKEDPGMIRKVIKSVEVLENELDIIVQQVVAQMGEMAEVERLFLNTIVSKVGWSHHVILMDKATTYSERLWYLLNTLEHGISRNVLAMQIESGLYKRQVKAQKISNFSDTLPAPLNFYVNLVNDKLKAANDNDTIGILLCKGKSKVLAEYALKSIKQPIGVSDYQLSKAIPAELRSQLPDIDELENELITQ